MSRQKKPVKKKSSTKLKIPKYIFHIYIAGKTHNCVDAIRNMQKICDEYISEGYIIEIIDLAMHPQLAEQDNILAIPMVVRKDSKPTRRVIGNLSNAEKVLIGLGIN